MPVLSSAIRYLINNWKNRCLGQPYDQWAWEYHQEESALDSPCVEVPPITNLTKAA